MTSTLDGLLADARSVWGHHPMTLPAVVHALGVVHGDLCRAVRDCDEGHDIDHGAVRRELGNLIVSGLRWINDLGYGRDECIAAALDAQRAYVASRAASELTRHDQQSGIHDRETR